MTKTTDALLAGVALSAALGCPGAAPGVEVVLAREPVTLSGEPQALAADQPLPADAASLGVCVSPGPGHHVSGRWTVLTPEAREAQIVAWAELVNGDVVKLASPSSSGSILCVHPRRGGPLDAPVRRVRVVASTPILAARVWWRCGPPGVG